MNDSNGALKQWLEQQGYSPQAAENTAGSIGYVVASVPDEIGLAASYWQQCLEALLRGDAAQGHAVDFDACADAVTRVGYMPSDVRERLRSIQAPARSA
jgi:hypothetical protein